MKTLYEAGVREVVYTTDDGGGKYQVERVRDLPKLTTQTVLDTVARRPVELRTRGQQDPREH